jgi:hypothetical protein
MGVERHDGKLMLNVKTPTKPQNSKSKFESNMDEWAAKERYRKVTTLARNPNSNERQNTRTKRQALTFELGCFGR